MALTPVNANRPSPTPVIAEAIAPAGVLTEVADHYLIDEAVTVGATLRLLTRTRITPEYQETITQGSQRRLKIEVLDYSSAFATGQPAYTNGATTAPFTESAGKVVAKTFSPWVVIDDLYAAAGDNA